MLKAIKYIFLGLFICSVIIISPAQAELAERACNWVTLGLAKETCQEPPKSPDIDELKRKAAEALDRAKEEAESCIKEGGCDLTKEENWKEIEQILDSVPQKIGSCLSRGDCSMAEKERWNQYLEDAKSFQKEAEEFLSKAESLENLEEYINDPTRAVRKTFEIYGKLADIALEGWVSNNFGHVTNKKQLKNKLEKSALIIYGKEITHSEDIRATQHAAASLVSGTPAPMGRYFHGLAVKMIDEFVESSKTVFERAPEILVEKYGSGKLKQFADFENTFKSDPMYLANALATYVSTGEIPDLAKMIARVDLSEFAIDFGIISYNQAQRFFDSEIPTPNTHQPYIAITLPDLQLDIEQAVKQETYDYDISNREKRNLAEIELEADTDAGSGYGNHSGSGVPSFSGEGGGSSSGSGSGSYSDGTNSSATCMTESTD